MTIKEFEMQYALGSLSHDMIQKLTNNSNTSKKILTILSADENYYVRQNVALNRNTPVKVLTKLSTNEAFHIKIAVARNPNVSIEALTKLTTDENVFIQEYARKRITDLADPKV